jgi:membrane protease YdiL (CAAX protease family)
MSSEIVSAPLPSRTQRFIRFPLIRAIIALLMVVGAIILVQLVMKLLGRQVFATDELPLLWKILMFLFMTAMAFFSYRFYVRLLEKRPVSELGKFGAIKELGVGCAIGAVLMVSIILILWMLGYYQVVAISSLVVLLLPFFRAVFTGFFEEIVFRGIIFRIMNESLGSWLAVIISSLLFGFAHSGEPNATLFSSIAIALEAGILLSAVYLFTRRLWMVIGLHFAWNFTLGGIFGVAVSGKQEGGLLQSQMDGPIILTGGEFGAETSILAVIICLLVGLYLLLKAKQRQHFISPFWRRNK